MVKVGQIWKDNDKRIDDRQIEIILVDEEYTGKATCRNIKTGKVTKVSLKRFVNNSTGYILIKDSQ